MAVGSAVQAAEASKRLKYAGLGSGYSFYPVAIETLGAWGKNAQGLVSELGSRLAALPGDPRSLAFLRQHLGIAMQRGNAAAVRETLSAHILYSFLKKWLTAVNEFSSMHAFVLSIA